MEFMVSWRSFGLGNCGNKTFQTLEEAERFASLNQITWMSYSIWQYEGGQRITELTTVKAVVNPWSSGR